MNKTKLQGHIAILITSLIFALNIPIAKSLMPSQVSPLAMTMLRLFFGAIAFWIASIFAPKEKVAKADMKILVLGSLFGLVINQMSFIIGLNSTSPVDASIIVSLTPVLVMIIAAIVLKEPITLKKSGGVLLGATGAIIVIFSQHKGITGAVSSLKGNLLCMLSSFSYAIYLIMAKPISQRYHAITLMKWMFLFGCIFAFPFCFSSVKTLDVNKILLPDTLWRVIYVLLGATFITYLLIPIALKRIRPTTFSMYNYLQPFIASWVAIGIGQDVFSWEKPLAGLLIFSGVYLVTISKSRADIEKAKKIDN